MDTARASVLFGPEMPDWGSWDWVGADTCNHLSAFYRTGTFTAEIPQADVVVVVKHLPHDEWIAALNPRTVLAYCPVDFYGSTADIDAEAGLLRRCSRVVVHCERLRRYFAPYAPVEYLDHHLKFATPPRDAFRSHGEILWVGVRTNIPPLAEWVNHHGLPGPLRVLTNPQDANRPPSAAELGFRSELEVRVEVWSPATHLRRTAECRVAIDVKGDDFRARHKPPAKALDFIASGVPLALNPNSSPAEHLARMGFEVATPDDPSRWLSHAYWEDPRRFGLALRELLSIERVGRRWRRLIDELLTAR